MAIKIPIKHRQSGMIKDGCYGFSWTYLIFGWFVPVFRGEIAIGLLHMLLTIFSFGLWQVIFCFLYNKQYMERMLSNNWKLSGTDEQNRLAREVLGIKS